MFHLWNVLFDDVDNGRHEVTFPECDMDAVSMEIGVVEQVLEIQRLRRGIVALAHANLNQVRGHTLFGTPRLFTTKNANSMNFRVILGNEHIRSKNGNFKEQQL